MNYEFSNGSPLQSNFNSADVFPNNYELRIMNYEFSNGSPLQSNFNSADVFPNNYALCIMNYELYKLYLCC